MKRGAIRMKKATQEQILSAVEERRDSVIAFLQSIVQIDSETGREAEIQAFISKKLTQMGLEVDEFEPDLETLKNHPGYVQPDIPYKGRPNVVGTFRGEGGGRSLLFNGHVDTVPTAPDDQWTDGPLSGSLRDGALWGRGASDMKGGLAAMTMALDVLLQIGRKPKGDVILEYVVDEERTGMGTLACVLKGYKADAGICCETSDLEVMPACIGRLWFRIDLRGKPSGIASRWESVSAIEKGILIVKAVDDLEKMRIDDLKHPLYPDNRGALPCAVTMFNSGTFPSVTPEDAVLKGSMGLMPYEDLEDAKQQLVDQVNLVSQADPWLRKNPPVVSFDEGLAAAGAEIPNDHPIVESVVAAFEAARGEPPVLGARKGAADTRFLIRYGETPTVIFGPGITAEMHAMNEHVPVENLISSTKVLALTIDDWCQ
jgi:acetylornithine deacetylase